MKRSVLASSVPTCLCLGLISPVLAAQPPVTRANSPKASGEKSVAATGADIKPADKCLSDLHAFNTQMGTDGYWLGGSGYGYGYPMGGGFGYGGNRPMVASSAESATGYRNARPGYEVRTLLASANILAQRGEQQSCEDVLTTTRSIYKRYVADLHGSGVHGADPSVWRKQQVSAAQPVTGTNTSFRSDELIGTDVRDAQNQALGSVDDLVMSPQTGKIAYLVIARGGLFGIDEKYVPVPWGDFKVTPNMGLLVLDTTTGAMDGAPQVDSDQFAAPNHFDQQSRKVDAYWKTHFVTKGSTGSNG
jgi:hypothetical protein